MISERLREIRENADITQQEIANNLGIKRSTYAGWENNIDPIPLIMLFKLCNIFNISMDYICNLSNKTNTILNKIDLNTIDIGKRIQDIRKKNNNTQKDISNIIGVDQSNYSKIENGKFLIKLYPLIEFAKHYNISIDYLCGRTNIQKIL